MFRLVAASYKFFNIACVLSPHDNGNAPASHGVQALVRPSLPPLLQAGSGAMLFEMGFELGFESGYLGCMVPHLSGHRPYLLRHVYPNVVMN
ncbi:hypothetical protein CsSME_00039496 [Camellia sinensis var. sinensis]